MTMCCDVHIMNFLMLLALPILVQGCFARIVYFQLFSTPTSDALGDFELPLVDLRAGFKYQDFEEL